MNGRGERKERGEEIPEERFFSRGKVSRLFGVSNSTVTRWARLGLLKAVRTPGGHYRYPAEETRKAADRAAAGELSRLD
jgi:excisionase family DNA binding protein